MGGKKFPKRVVTHGFPVGESAWDAFTFCGRPPGNGQAVTHEVKLINCKSCKNTIAFKDLPRQLRLQASREEPHNRWTCPGCPWHD